MKQSTQASIRYRDFYDIPRAIIVEIEGGLYFLDCKFDSDADDYSLYFDVFKLARTELSELEILDWSTLSELGEQIGRIAAADITFDQTKREYIDDSELKALIANQS
jgi:hypothetical protein